MRSEQGKLLSEIVTFDIVSVSPKTSVLQTIELMRSRKISCVMILEDKKPVGIFTERNIVRFAAGRHAEYDNDCAISMLMSAPVVTGKASADIFEAYNLLNTHQIRHLVVVNEQGEAIGVVTQSDIIDNLGYENFLETKPISRIMSKNLYIIPPETPLPVVLAGLAAKRLSCALVSRSGKPAGIITERDMAKLLVDKLDIAHLSIGEVMTAPLITVPCDVNVLAAARLMREHKIRRLVVVDDNGSIAGLTTQTDIIKELEAKYIDILRQIIRQQDLRLESITRDLAKTTVYLENILRWSLDMGVVAINLDFEIVYFNPAAEVQLEVHARDVVGKDVSVLKRVDGEELVGREDLLRTRERFSRILFVFQASNDHSHRFLQARVSGIWDKENQIFGFVIMLHDITEQKRTEEKLAYMATHDALTGLPNRMLFNDLIQLEISRSARNRKKFAVLFLDLDEFKTINDTFGHAAGDVVLCTFSARLRKSLRKSDTVARMGGDEFMVLLPSLTTGQEAGDVARKIIEAVRKPFIIEDREFRVTVSIGISVYPDDSEATEQLIIRADKAMYIAKNSGKNKCVHYSEKLFGEQGNE